MPADIKNILSNLSSDVDQEALLLYLQGKLSGDKAHEVEERLLNDEFESEAMDGLEAMSDKQRITSIVNALNQDLKNKMSKRKMLSKKMKLQLQPIILFAIVLILLLIVISYFIIHSLAQTR